jgi:putative tryptophan/tyrosine transport system substrate-binding protein
MRRSTIGLLVMLTLAGLVAPRAIEAQQPTHVHRIGWLCACSPPTAPDWKQASSFLQGLRDLGHVEGDNFVLEARWAEGSPERLPDLAAELVRLKVDVTYADGDVLVV